jgi:hypothetical protein
MDNEHLDLFHGIWMSVSVGDEPGSLVGSSRVDGGVLGVNLQ